MSIISFILIIFIIIIILYLLRLFFKGAQCKIKHSLKGKIIIVTGASAGIGKESALDLVRHGAQVILACRNEQRTKEAMKSLNEEEKKLIKFIKCDLNDFSSIIKFAEQVKKDYTKIDILMNNAGLFPQQYNVTKDNMESYLQGNFTGHVLLTFLLFDILDKNDARIINLSSIAYLGTDFINDINIKELYDLNKSEEKYFGGIKGKGKLYSNTKILMIYFSKYLTKICEKKYTYIKSAAAHPGGVDPETSHSTIEMRKVVLEFNLKLFGLSNVTFDGTHALIEGKKGKYRIHLGSGVIHKVGGHQINIVAVQGSRRSKIFLPYIDEDPKTAEIMTKVLMFAEDNKIKDPEIIRQMY